jgi:hypothetical protein
MVAGSTRRIPEKGQSRFVVERCTVHGQLHLLESIAGIDIGTDARLTKAHVRIERIRHCSSTASSMPVTASLLKYNDDDEDDVVSLERKARATATILVTAFVRLRPCGCRLLLMLCGMSTALVQA